MPWDATSLKAADLGNDGSVKRVKSVVNASDGEAVMQPSWTRDGRLMFISDRSGWWNLYQVDPFAREVRAIAPLSAEIGKPAWYFGARGLCCHADRCYRCCGPRRAADAIEIVDPAGRAVWRTHTSNYATADALHVRKNRLVFLGSGRASINALVELDPMPVECASYIVDGKRPDPEYASMPQSVEFAGADGLPTFAWFIRPPTRSFGSSGDGAPRHHRGARRSNGA